MTVLWLTESDIGQILTPANVMESLERMFDSNSDDQLQSIPRRRVSIDGMVMHSMSAADRRLNRSAWKQYTTTRGRARFLVGLYGKSDQGGDAGELLALISADRLGQLRTGAMCAFAARRLLTDQDGVLHEPNVIAVIGNGWQAESQLECMAEAFPRSQLCAAGRGAEKAVRFAEEMSRRLQRAIAPSPSIDAALSEAGVIVTMTSAREPVLPVELPTSCRLIVAAGSNQARNRELPTPLVQAAARIVVDDEEGVRREAGDLIIAAAETDEPTVWAKVLGIASAPRWNADQIASSLQLFKSVGMAAADLAAASVAYDLALLEGRGTKLPDLFAD